ncbi:protein DOUBLE-STRAND BREAK FORMATION isoform X2 [Prosopis cineraria]|uniref:protein DOUBLE-STRAND BREAK FORMATION isoform X2 n=1 Tax=Prosopis cineraria TaxID=364024 RepID=UPI00240EDA48|nr:protein DOUBLE-STRAND BREAK FORMATION isoform X2 [Prosopis cineraria]
MARPAQEQLSLLRSLIDARSFDEATLRILRSFLVSKDVESSMQVRYSFTEFLRSQSISVIRSIASKTVLEKLYILDFFVRAFAIVGDVESCLALRYEALLMRNLKSASYQWLHVSSVEWLNFVEDALHSGFHSIAEKACQHALLSIRKNDVLEPGLDGVPENAGAIRTMTRLRNCAMTSIASRSVLLSQRTSRTVL